MSSTTQIRCRGLRKWCDRRCDVTSGVAPVGYPTVGFYCSLHKYQEPKVGMDGTIKFDTERLETHVRRRTSFVAPEASVAQDMAKAPGVVRERADIGKTAQGADIITWLKDRRGFDDSAAMNYAQRMIDLSMLVPVRKEHKKFSVDKNAHYYVQSNGSTAGAGR